MSGSPILFSIVWTHSRKLQGQIDSELNLYKKKAVGHGIY